MVSKCGISMVCDDHTSRELNVILFLHIGPTVPTCILRFLRRSSTMPKAMSNNGDRRPKLRNCKTKFLRVGSTATVSNSASTRTSRLPSNYLVCLLGKNSSMSLPTTCVRCINMCSPWPWLIPSIRGTKYNTPLRSQLAGLPTQRDTCAAPLSTQALLA